MIEIDVAALVNTLGHIDGAMAAAFPAVEKTIAYANRASAESRCFRIKPRHPDEPGPPDDGKARAQQRHALRAQPADPRHQSQTKPEARPELKGRVRKGSIR